jgi:hypothetical protein
LLLQSTGESVPEFEFLKDKGSFIKIDLSDQSMTKEIRFVYSFEADYNDIVADANLELSALGYKGNFSQPKEAFYRSCTYFLRGEKPGASISVEFIDKNELIAYETPKNSEYPSPDRYEYHIRDGWVSVQITLKSKKNRFMYKITSLLDKLKSSD